jgi:hypothetical protein
MMELGQDNIVSFILSDSKALPHSERQFLLLPAGGEKTPQLGQK